MAQRIGCHAVATTDPGRVQESQLDYPALAACAQASGGLDRLGTGVWNQGGPVYSLFVTGGTTARAQWLATGPRQLGAPYDDGQPWPGGTLQEFDVGYVLTRPDGSTEVLGTNSSLWPADATLGYGVASNNYVYFPMTACAMALGGPAAVGTPAGPVQFTRTAYYQQDFTGGTLGHTSCYMFETDSAALAVSDPFWAAWSVGGLGKPVANQVVTASGAYQHFSIGWVVWDRASGQLSLAATEP